MNSQVLQIAVPLILLGSLAAFFASLAWQALHETEQGLMKKPLLVVEDSPNHLNAETALSQASLDALIDKHRDELLANPPTNKFWLDETVLGLIPGKW